MNAKYIVPLVAAFLLAACTMRNEPKLESKGKEKHLLVGKIDTAKVLKEMAIVEKVSRFQNINEKLPSLSSQVDTFYLTYHFNWCDCEHWFPDTVYKAQLAKDTSIAKMDANKQGSFNREKYGFYIEEADEIVALPENVGINGTTIKFVGRLYTDKRFPKGHSTEQDHYKGRVLRYYSYEILHPYKVWGPHLFEEIDTDTGDSTGRPTELTVE